MQSLMRVIDDEDTSNTIYQEVVQSQQKKTDGQKTMHAQKVDLLQCPQMETYDKDSMPMVQQNVISRRGGYEGSWLIIILDNKIFAVSVVEAWCPVYQ